MPNQNMVELPLDPEYITADGFYMSGYLWGQHVRSERDARQMFPGDTKGHEDFYKGVADGYNDKMTEINAEMEAKKKQPNKTDEDVEYLIESAGNLYRESGLSLEQYKKVITEATQHYDFKKLDDIPF